MQNGHPWVTLACPDFDLKRKRYVCNSCTVLPQPVSHPTFLSEGTTLGNTALVSGAAPGWGASHGHREHPTGMESIHVVPWRDANALWCVGAARLRPLPPALAATSSKMGNYWF